MEDFEKKKKNPASILRPKIQIHAHNCCTKKKTLREEKISTRPGKKFCSVSKC